MADPIDPWAAFRTSPPRPPEPPAPPAPPEGAGGVAPPASPAVDPWALFRTAPADNLVAEIGDGRVVRAADGSLAFTSPAYATTDQDVIARMMAGATPVDAQNYAHAPSNSALAAATGFVQGGTFGAGDELTAALDSALSDRSYDASLERARAIFGRNEDDNPLAYYPGLLGGAVAGALGIGQAAAPALGGAGATSAAAGMGVNATRSALGLPVAAEATAPLWARAAAGAGVGAVDGALSGFGGSEGGFSERADDALTGALIGGALGGALPPVTQAVRSGAGAVTNLVTAPFAKGADQTAVGRAIFQSMNRAKVTADDVSGRVAAAAAEGQPMFTVADAIGTPAQRRLNGIARQPGEASTEIADYLFRRQNEQGGRLAGFVGDALGATDTAAQRSAALTEARDAAADAAFSAARADASPVDVRGVLQAIDDRIGGMQGVNIDPGSIDGTLAKYRARLASPTPATDRVPGAPLAAGPGGEQTAVELSDFSRVFRVRKDVSNQITAALRRGENELAKELIAVKGALDDAMAGASPTYKAAMKDYATASGVIGSVDAGTAAAAPRRRYADTLEEYLALSPDEQAAFKTGYADPVMARVEAAKPGVNKAASLRGDKIDAELGAMAADPDLLRRQIDRENDMFRTYNMTQGGSATASNLADVTNEQRFASMLSGEALVNPMYALRRGAGRVTDIMLNGLRGENEATRRSIGQALLSTDLEAALRPYLEAAQRRAQAESLIGMTVRSGTNRAVMGRE